MSKYKIIEVLACNSSDEFVRRYWYDTPEKKIYEVWKFNKSRFLFWTSEEWLLVDNYHTIKDAKDKILRLKGEHPEQLKRKELQKEQPKVVYEE